MKKRSIFKNGLKIILGIIIIFLISIIIKYNTENKDSIKKYEIPTLQISTVSIVNNKQEKIDIGDLKTVVLYNTVLVPINDTFSALFGNDYVPNTNQTLKQGTMTLNIDFDNNTITIPKTTTYSSQKMDDTVVVEIENYENIKYIPLYLISNFNNITVKLDNTEIYKNENYISSIDVIKKSTGKHNIEILLNTENISKNETYIGQAKGSLWREEALKRIEKYRKEYINVVIKNQNNRIYSNVNTKINMINNEFNFGTAIAYNGKVNNYNGITKSIFNMIGAENSFKWKTIEQYGYNRAIDIISNATNNNMKVRAHCLWWDYIFSNDVEKIVGNIENPEEGTMASVYKNYTDGNITEGEAERLSINIQNEFENIILSHIEQEFSIFSNIDEWDIINEILTKQYFKTYLYDRKYLTDSSFLNGNNVGYTNSYVKNEEYYKFLAKCFDKARMLNNKTKLVLNDNIVKGNIQGELINDYIKAINGIKMYTNNIDVLGIQYHVSNKYYYSPQSYYNNINRVLNEIGIKEAVITEYDNYLSEELGNYTNEEKKVKADYLRDSVIMAYSNPNISEFTFWVYNSKRFEEEERQAYEELVTPWLNYSEQGVSSENGYTTRLYKGEYTAKVTLANGKEKEVTFKVSDDSNKTIEVIFVADLNNINISRLPNRTTYYQGSNLSLDGGTIKAFFDDDTVEEISMTDSKVKVTGYNKNLLGKQILTVTYNNKSATFEIEVVENVKNKVEEAVNIIKQANNTARNNNIVCYSNKQVNAKYQTLVKALDSLVNNFENSSLNTVDDILTKQFDVLNTLVTEYNNGNIKITTEQFKGAIQDLINVTNNYKILYSYYVRQENNEINGQVQTSLNNLIDKLNNNLDLDISFITDFVLEEKNIYNNSLQTTSPSENYLNKQRIIKLSDILISIIDNKIDLFKKEEKSKIKVIADTDTNTTTNKDVTVTLEHGDYTKIVNNEGKNTYTFTQNGNFIFKVEIRREIFSVLVTIDNIDKSKKDQTSENTDSKYKMDEKYITRIDKGTQVNVLKKNLIVDGSYKIMRNGKEIQNLNENIVTGDILQVGNKKYTLVVTGDINSDGQCNIKDLIIYRNYMLGTTELSNIQQKAANVKDDNELNLKDLLNLRSEILK